MQPSSVQSDLRLPGWRPGNPGRGGPAPAGLNHLRPSATTDNAKTAWVSTFSSDQQPGLPGQGQSLVSVQFHRLLVHTQKPDRTELPESTKPLFVADPQGEQSATEQLAPTVGGVLASHTGIGDGSL